MELLTYENNIKVQYLKEPIGRVGTPDDIVSMIMFLISPENSFITGANFTVDGGMTRKMIYV